MPEINGVWLNNIPRSQKEIATIQKKIKCYSFASRALVYVNISPYLFGGVLFYNFMCSVKQRSTDRTISTLSDTNSYSKQMMRFSGRDPSKYEIEGDINETEKNAMIFLAVSVAAMGLAIIPLRILRNHCIRKHNNYIRILEASKKLQVLEYKDMQCYEQVISIDKTNVGPISCVPVEEIEQKVFYRREVYEYYYLLTAYATNPKGRDHTGQLYDISLFYRIDDNNIQYID